MDTCWRLPAGKGQSGHADARARVGPAAFSLGLPEPPPFDKAADSRLHRSQDLRHVHCADAPRRMKDHHAGGIPRDDAVEHRRVAKISR
jgi:hypothetical protein